MLRSASTQTRICVRAAAFATILAITAAGSAQAATSLHPVAYAASARAAAVRPGANVFTTIDNPLDRTFNQLLGIDDRGVISGYYGSGAKGHPNKGYTIAQPYNTFLPDNLPASAQTQATGIANDDVTTTGFWAPTDLGLGPTGLPQDANYGFIRLVTGGVTLYLSVNDPLVSSTPSVNQVLGINADLNAVGFYNDAANAPHGFIYSVKTGNFMPFNIPGQVSDAVTGINSNNVVSGFFTDAKGNTKGFLQSLVNGKNVHYIVPGSTVTQFFGVNASNVAVGSYLGKDNFPHGTIYNAATNHLTIVNDPQGAQGTVLNGINDRGNIVGFYTDAKGNTHGLLVRGLQ